MTIHTRTLRFAPCHSAIKFGHDDSSYSSVVYDFKGLLETRLASYPDPDTYDDAMKVRACPFEIKLSTHRNTINHQLPTTHHHLDQGHVALKLVGQEKEMISTLLAEI